MQYDNHPLPTSDGDYEPATIASLVPGASARMLDPRRTPVRISELAPEIASFNVKVLAFEDAGAVWELPLWDIAKFQVKRGSKKISLSEQAVLVAKVEQFKKRNFVNCDAHSITQTKNKLKSMTADAEEWLKSNSQALKTARDIEVEAGKGFEEFRADLENWLKSRGLTGSTPAIPIRENLLRDTASFWQSSEFAPMKGMSNAIQSYLTGFGHDRFAQSILLPDCHLFGRHSNGSAFEVFLYIEQHIQTTALRLRETQGSFPQHLDVMLPWRFLKQVIKPSKLRSAGNTCLSSVFL